MNPSDFVASLRSAAPYVHAHNRRVFVLALGGEAADLPDFDKLIYDIALLRSLGVKLVLVHGARPQIERQLRERGLPSRFEAGLRVTDRPALECVKAAVGSLRMEIEARLSTSLASTPMGGARVPVAGGNWVMAQPVGVRAGVDYQQTGEIRRVDADAILREVEADRIALVSPVGYSPTGEIFNLRSEVVATAVATAIRADKLIFLVGSDPDAWRLADDTGDAGQLSLADGEQLLASGALDTQDRGYLEAALAAARAGVKRVHLLGAQTEGALLRELYTRDGAGLMVYADSGYDESIRPATIDDIGGILALIKPLERDGVLVPRSREQLELEIGRFFVMVRDGLVIACAALIPLDSSAGEFACVAVHADYKNGGRAAMLLARAEADARRLGLSTLLSLTTHTPHWFVEHGFTQGTPDDLPAERRRLYNYRRNSLVLVKAL